MASKHRLSVNLGPDEFRGLAAVAEAANVSLAWLGRQAIRQFLEAHNERGMQIPLALPKPVKRGNL